MMTSWSGRLATGLLLMLALVVPMLALEPPTPEQLKQYRADGSLEWRIRNAEALGNHRVAPWLQDRVQYRLNRLMLQRQGLDAKAVDAVLAPPPAWQGMPTKGTVKVLALLLSFQEKAAKGWPWASA